MDNKDFGNMLLELLEIEKKNDIFNLTSAERSQLEDYVKFANKVMKNYKNILEKLANMEPEVFYAGGNWGLYKDGYNDACEKVDSLMCELFG